MLPWYLYLYSFFKYDDQYVCSDHHKISLVVLLTVTAHQACVRLSFLLNEVPFYCERVVYIIMYQFIKFDRKWPQFCVFDNKIWTQQHFESRLFWKKWREAENLRITDAVCFGGFSKFTKTCDMFVGICLYHSNGNLVTHIVNTPLPKTFLW